jgi:hypothetical protein
VPRDALISTSVSSALLIELQSVNQTFAVSSPSIAVDILTTSLYETRPRRRQA